MTRTGIAFSALALELQATARRIADETVRPAAARYDKAQEYNYEAAREVAQAGLFKTFVPCEYGGHGAGRQVLALHLADVNLDARPGVETNKNHGNAGRLLLSFVVNTHVGFGGERPVLAK